MKKINTILAAFSALLMLSVTSANSLEFKAGVSANGMAAYANAKETLKDSGRVSNAEAILATSFASVFAEVSSDEMMGLGIGISYAPEVADLNKETREIDTCNDQTSQNTGAACVAKTGTSADSGTTTVDAKINDLLSVYLTLPVGDTGAYFKAGYMQATMVTEESLATGSKYEDVDMTGTSLGGGFEGSLGDMAFWRAEGSYQMWEDISASGSEAGATTGAKNKITAELGSVTGSLSVGMAF
ncbi:hypothetical protein OAO33_00305 [Candidatus Pelagibacter sp.]|jgi:hypothetical protein|nr:hypothetical protein [Candidatus Pelagibacter sp.]